MHLTTKSTSGVVDGLLPLDADAVARTLQPLERASMLPTDAFLDDRVLAWEQERIYAEGWICAGHVSAVAEPGAYVVRDVGDDSVFVVGTREGPRAFHNVCRHRGSRLLEEPAGRVRGRIRCPYHAWSYGLDGSLLGTRHTEGLEDFDPACYGLAPVRCEVAGGLLMLNFDGDAPPLEDHLGEITSWLERYRVGELVPRGERVYDVQANWKAIAENYNECLHCPGVHPELNALSHYASGDAVHGPGAWCGGSMTLNEGAETMGRDGGRGHRPPIGGLGEADMGLVYYFALFPNALVSLHPDYVMLHTLWPREPGRTAVTCEWLFEPQTAAAPDFDPQDAIEFWDQVNREDWHVCELSQRGMRSRGYSPGRYTTHEADVHTFDVMVAERYMAALHSTEAAPVAT